LNGAESAWLSRSIEERFLRCTSRLVREANEKKKRRLAPVGMTNVVGKVAERNAKAGSSPAWERRRVRNDTLWVGGESEMNAVGDGLLGWRMDLVSLKLRNLVFGIVDMTPAGVEISCTPFQI